MYTYEEAIEASKEYFNGNELAAKVFVDKYALRDTNSNLLEKTPDEMHQRMASEFARIEAKKFNNPLSYSKIYNLFKDFTYIIPQGSPMFGIGNDHQIVSLSNCYLLDIPLDSYNSILEIDKQLVNISKRRGGVGIDLTNLRPKNTPTNNAARASTGITSWMERYSNSIREVGQNARRGALMLTISIHHPDILDFCTIKNDPTKVTGANISVRLTREFLDAVKNDAEYELRWPEENPKIRKMVSAKEVWDTIINSAWLRAEPGLLMWDNVTENTPADCYEEYRSRGTNPCSEINLSPLDSCRLLCLNLLSYVVNPFTDNAYFDYGLFYEHAQIAQRLMDNMVDLEAEKIEAIIAKIDSDPEPDNVKQDERNMWGKILKFNNEGRRTGTGITAIADALAAIGVKYGSEESIKVTEKIYIALKFGCYRSSIDMAKELGPFKCCDAEKEKDCKFLSKFQNESLDITIPNYSPATGLDIVCNARRPIFGKEIYDDMQKYGRRNIALTTTAPTGTLSILTQTSSGIEPVFMLSYVRRKKINPNDEGSKVDFTDANGDKWQEFTVYHPTVKKWMEITGKTNIEESPWFGATANDINWINRVRLQSAAQNHVCHAISSTVNLPETVTKEEVAKIYETAFASNCKGLTIYRDNCRSGVLVNKDQAAKKNNNEGDRPKELPCEVFHTTIKGTSYFVLVGLMNDVPYEVFAGRNGFLDKNIKTGKIIKIKKRQYKAIFDDETELSPITATSSEHEETITRLTSALLRSGASMQTIVQQLERVSGDMHSFAKGLARMLKKYIPDGTEEKGEECPECKQKSLVRAEGCVSCKNCNWSKCS